MSRACLFCNPSEPCKAFVRDFFYGIFDHFPVSPGHMLVIPRRHVLDLTELTPQEWQALQPTLKLARSTIENTDLSAVYQYLLQNPVNANAARFCRRALHHPRINTKPDGYNHGVNQGQAAGRSIEHLHWHIIPRYHGDMADPTGGVRHVIPELGNYHQPL